MAPSRGRPQGRRPCGARDAGEGRGRCLLEFPIQRRRRSMMQRAMLPAISTRLLSTALLLLLIPAIALAEPSTEWSLGPAPSPGPARVIGGVAHGCLAGALPLPGDGPGYQVIRLSRRRDFGHPD